MPSRQHYHTVVREQGHAAVEEVYRQKLETVKEEVEKEYGEKVLDCSFATHYSLKGESITVNECE